MFSHLVAVVFRVHRPVEEVAVVVVCRQASRPAGSQITWK